MDLREEIGNSAGAEVARDQMNAIDFAILAALFKAGDARRMHSYPPINRCTGGGYWWKVPKGPIQAGLLMRIEHG